MTFPHFAKTWRATFGLTPPLAYLFRAAYPARWFRIHSLPASRRVPENESEWAILLRRQNELIRDLLGEDTLVWLVTGTYALTHHHLETFSPVGALAHLSFTSPPLIPLLPLNQAATTDDYQPGDVYQAFYSEIRWQPAHWDSLLRELAQEEYRAFFVSFERKLLIAPYDGGVDLIVKDEATRDVYKAKYQDWLSSRQDGL